MIALGPITALVLAAGPACGLPPLREAAFPFRPGETLTYDFDVMGIVKAGTLTLGVEPPISRGTLLPLRARVRNTSVFAKIRRVKGYALSWVDVHDLRPQRYRDDVEEDGVRKTTDTRLDVPGPVTMTWAFGDRKGTTTVPREGVIMDLLSLVYYLRDARLEPGKEMCVDVVANRRFWKFRGSVGELKERVESPAGIFDTIRIDAVLTRADGSGGKRPVHLWFSKDAHHFPVAVVSEVDLGPVRATLSRISGASAAADH